MEASTPDTFLVSEKFSLLNPSPADALKWEIQHIGGASL
jgi:hypothetical protein